MPGRNILFYADAQAETRNRLNEAIKQVARIENIESFQSLEEFSLRLQRPKDEIASTVLLVGEAQALIKLVGIRKQLGDLRLVIIIPDREKETIANAHRLFPRYLSYTDGDFKDVSAVLLNMMHG